MYESRTTNIIRLYADPGKSKADTSYAAARGHCWKMYV
jgi:hypothetical protein